MPSASNPNNLGNSSNPASLNNLSNSNNLGNLNNPKKLPREQTRQVHIGDVLMGGASPVSVQTMLATAPTDVDGALKQIEQLAAIGCEIVRLAIPSPSALDNFAEICSGSVLPVVADIHFDFRLAIEAAARGAAKLRINPGNIGDWSRTDAVIDAAAQAGIPIRIGVNAGSLEAKYLEMDGMSVPERLAASAIDYVEHFEARGFYDIVVSAKAHDVQTTIQAYRLLSQKLPDIPLHIGITEAGTLRQGTVKSSVGLGILLSEGIGNTMRVSLTSDVEEEVKVAWEILSALGLRRRSPEIISCPTCGRTRIDLIPIANEVSDRLQSIEKPIKVAVMGCVVNGPGEAADADIGMAAGRGQGTIFVRGQVIRKVAESEIVDALFEEIDKL